MGGQKEFRGFHSPSVNILSIQEKLIYRGDEENQACFKMFYTI